MIKKIIKKIKFFYYLNDLNNLFLANIKGFFLSKQKITFVQIPRTTTTLINELIKKNIKNSKKIYTPNHYLKPKYCFLDNYFVTLRDPVERFVSAYYHLKNSQFITYYKDFFEKYPTIDALADKITLKRTKNYIRLSHHLNENLNTFFSIDVINKNKPIFIIDNQYLKKDLKIFFSYFLNIKNINLNVIDNKKKITKKSILKKKTKNKLKRFLAEDYLIYYELKKIRKKILNSLQKF